MWYSTLSVCEKADASLSITHEMMPLGASFHVAVILGSPLELDDMHADPTSGKYVAIAVQHLVGLVIHFW